MATEVISAERAIIVTNRGPVEYYLDQHKALKHRRGAGGVVTALLAAMQQLEATWVSLAMTEGDRLAMKETPNGTLTSPLPGRPMQLHYVTIPKAVYRKYYEIISNQVLWFTQHYLDYSDALPSGEPLRRAWENGYVQANQAIADTVVEEITRESSRVVVMLHDYHLYLAPAMIRAKHPSAVIEHFIHIPWPEIRYWQSSIPELLAQAIFLGMLGSDLIGMQTQRDAQNFLEGVREIVPEADVDLEEGTICWREHVTRVRDYPISISVADERRIMQSRAGKRAAERIRPYLCEMNIMRVDRIEPTKNIVLGFQAYDLLLQKHSELHGKVTFLAFLVPSREKLRTYRKYKDEVLALIDDINQKYGQPHWRPIQSFVQNDRTQALAALQYYDALLVNPLIDGMNLVAKEGPVVNKNDGVLLLSRTSGAFQQMENACIPLSPRAPVETAERLYEALTLPKDERRDLARRAREEVEQNDLQAWIHQQVHDINQMIEANTRLSNQRT